jgi:hypothetical protein
MFEQSLAMNQEAFEGEEFDVAYHALMVALHCAQSLQSVERLSQVEALARSQLTYIDNHHPEYSHSTASAQKRHHVSIFETTAQQANARILIIKRRRASYE